MRWGRNSQLWLLGYEVTGGGGETIGLVGGTERQRREEELKKKKLEEKEKQDRGVEEIINRAELGCMGLSGVRAGQGGKTGRGKRNKV